MEPLNLPTYFFSIKEDKGKKYIFDEIRRRYVSLTPEEWVRQHIIKYLTEEKNFPRQLLSVEKGHHRNRLYKRHDVLVYDRTGKPVLIVECKAPDIEISQKVFDQASRYNEQYNAPYLLVTNGKKHYCCQIDPVNRSFVFLKDIPFFKDLSVP